MNTNTTQVKPAGEAGGQSRGDVDWSAVKPVQVDHEDAMSKEQCDNVWNEMMRTAGLKAPSENQRAAFRLAVYTYGCLNGTSRVGNYSGSFKLADGTTVSASVIPAATGKFAIRKFFRGCMEESYKALKQSGVIAGNQRMVAKAATLGIQADCAFAMADWMANCPLFTPLEQAAHDAAFANSVERAKRARGGHDLVQVEDGNRRRMLHAQGTLDAPAGETVDF